MSYRLMIMIEECIQLSFSSFTVKFMIPLQLETDNMINHYSSRCVRYTMT